VKDDELLVARESFSCEIDGIRFTVAGGVTRVRADHPLVKGREQLFEPAGERAELVQATAAPGEKRGRVRKADGGRG
jgi:hypothetical protein